MKALPRDFWLLCLSTLIFMLSFNLILPELNEFLALMGEGTEKWAVLVPWTLSAMLLRPLSGKMADVVGRKFVINFGIIINILAALFYPYAILLSTFFILRLFHGFCAGFQPTGSSALAADLIPEKIRGEAMGIFSISISLGFGFGWILSSPIKASFGIEGLFYAVSIAGIISLLLMMPIKETQVRRSDFKVKDIIPKFEEILSKHVFVPTAIMLLITICTGFYILLIPDMTTYLKIENKGWFFFMHMLSSLIVRYLAGRVSDRIGRRKALTMGVAIFAVATALMTWVDGIGLFLFCGILYGIGTGVISPTLMAWTTDLSNPKYKGRGLATMWMGLEFGLLVGSFLGMELYQNKPENFALLFSIAFFILAAIVVYLLTFGRKVPAKYIEKEKPQTKMFEAF